MRRERGIDRCIMIVTPRLCQLRLIAIFEINLVGDQTFDLGVFHFKYITEHGVKETAFFPRDPNRAFRITGEIAPQGIEVLSG